MIGWIDIVQGRTEEKRERQRKIGWIDIVQGRTEEKRERHKYRKEKEAGKEESVSDR